MAQRTMKVIVSPIDTTTNFTRVGQEVNFINITEGSNIATLPPTPLDYSEMNSDVVALWNYQEYPSGGDPRLQLYNGLSVIRSSDELATSVFRQEIGYSDSGTIVPLTPLTKVDSDATDFHFRDYNVSNNRWYRYVLYPADMDTPLSRVEKNVKTSWGGWSITELHPIDSSWKSFSASPEDVWLFSYNVETGDQGQNIARNEQQTLGQFPRYAQGRMNYITGTVSCLLGHQMLPASYIIENGQMKRQGGYQEKMPFTGTVSSNDKVDMLQGWRKVVFSGNPKILKDRKGQAFLVTLSDASNKPMDQVRYQPDRISFTWHQIGTVDGLQITGSVL